MAKKTKNITEKEKQKYKAYFEGKTGIFIIKKLTRDIIECCKLPEAIELKHEMKNTQSKIKLIKVGKQPTTMYCFGCKGYTQHFRPEKVKMTNKVPREKSHCVFCQSIKSRFLKQKIN